MTTRLPNICWLFSLFICFFGIFIWIEPARSQVKVTTYHYDNKRTGQNTQEIILTPASVSSAAFGKQFSVAVDGAVYAQPLVLNNVTIAGVTHNAVVYVATEHDSVYAIDSDTGTPLWQVSFINPAQGITPIPSTDVNCDDFQPEIGITSTPVIDPVTGTLYVVALTKENGSYAQTLHALSVTSGAEMFGGPVLISASVMGSGDGSNGIQISFNPLTENNRAALLLESGHVIIAWASNCDNGPYHGWVMSYSASTLAQEAVFNTTPKGGLGGIWMSGAGLASDSSSNIYLATGNGSYDGSFDYGDSVMKLGGPGGSGFTVEDWFTPYTQLVLSEDDLDQGSGGVLLLPDQPIGAPNQHLALQAGKDGTIYLLNRDNMGKYNPNANNVVQSVPGTLNSVFGVPAWWNNTAYFGGVNDALMAFPFDPVAGMLDSATSASSVSFGFPGTTPIVSANGTTGGIVWALQYSGNGQTVLHAFDATNLGNEFYNSGQVVPRDNAGAGVKFSVPVVANGKVFVGTQTQLSVFGSILSSPLAGVTVNYSSVMGGVSAIGTVTLLSPAPAGGLVVGLASSDPSTSVPATVTIAPNATSATFPVSTSRVKTSIVVTISAMVDGTKSASLTVMSSGVGIQISLNSSTLSSGQSQQFTATVTGTTNTAVTWSMTPQVGGLSQTGMYTAPTGLFPLQTVTVTVTSLADNLQTASATVTLMPATPTVTVTGGTFSYDGNPHAALATAVGVDGHTPVNGSFSFTYTPSGYTPLPTDPGTYAVTATFISGDPNYSNAIGTVSITITPTALPYVTLNNANAPVIAYGSSTLSTSMAVAPQGSNTVAFAIVWADEGGGAPGTTFNVTATYGGQSMASAGATSYDYDYAPISCQVFYLVNPPTGTNTLVVNATASSGTIQEVAANLISFNGVNQTAPVRPGTYQTLHSATGVTVGTVAATIASNPSDLTLGALEQTYHFAATPTNQVNDGVHAAYYGIGSDHATTGAASVADTWSFTYPYAFYAYVGFSIQGAGVAATQSLNYTANPASRSYGAGNPAFTGTVTGFVGSDTQASVTTGTLTFTSPATSSSSVGNYAINGSGLTVSSGNYALVQAASNATALTITPATPTVIFTGVTASFDGNPHGATATAVGVDGHTPVNGSFGFSYAPPGNATIPIAIGTYTVTASFTSSDPNYGNATGTGPFTITSPVTPTLVYTATPVQRSYGTANPAFSGTVTGFTGTDTQTNATTGPLTFTTSATASSAAGSYAINGSGLTANNGKYNFAQAAANATALTIMPATPTVTVTGGTFSYDGNPHGATATAVGADGHTPVNGSFTFTYTPSGYTPIPTSAGTYSVTANFTSSDPNYNNAAGMASITITPVALSYVTLNNANAPVVVFGSSTLSTPMIVTSGGSNTVAFATVWVDEGGGAPGTTFNVVATYGGQPMTSAGATSYDYDYAPISSQVFYLVNPPTGTNTLVVNATASSGTIQEVATNLISFNGVNQATPVRPGSYQTLNSAPGTTVGTVTATIPSNPSDLTLGAIEQTFHFTSAPSNQTLDGVKAADFGVGSDHGTTGAASVVDTWSFTYPFAFYAYAGFSIQAASGAATPALTYTASPATRSYGGANPAFTGTVTGFTGTDTQANATAGIMTFTSPASSSSNVGNFAIYGSGLTANNGKYAFLQAASNATALTITPATPTVTVTTGTFSYDGNPHGATATAVGVDGHTPVNGTFSFTYTPPGNATIPSAVGTYAVTASFTSSDPNYVNSSGTGSLTIAPTLTYSATPAQRSYGGANPVFSGIVMGFIAPDTQTNSTVGTLTFNSSATASSNVGSYAISGSGLTANNGKYLFVQAASNATALTVTPATPTVTVTGGSFAYDSYAHAATATAVGVDGHTPVSGSFTVVYTPPGNGTIPTAVGTYAVTVSFTSSDPNYANTNGAGSITITPSLTPFLTYTATPANRSYGASNPVFSGTVTGFIAPDTQLNSTMGALTFMSSATVSSSVGSYPITGSGLTANSGKYNFQQAPGNAAALTITQATPTVTVTGGTFSYNGNPHGATATAVGVDGHTPVSGSFSFTYTPPGNSTIPTAAGIYAVTANFTSSDPNYSNATGTGSITIAASASSAVIFNNTNAAVVSFGSGPFNKPMTVTPGGSNTVAFATVWVDEGSGAAGTTFLVTATYGGQAMTSAGAASYDYDYAPISCQVFYLVNPPTGTNILAVSATASSGTIQEIAANLISFNGVNQTAPVRPGTYQALHSATGVTVGSVAATIASNPNDLILGAIEQTYHFTAAPTNQTLDSVHAADYGVGSDHGTNGSASVVDTWSFTYPFAYYAYVGFSIQAGP